MSRLLGAVLVVLSAVVVSGLFRVNASVPNVAPREHPVTVSQAPPIPCRLSTGPYKVSFPNVQNRNCKLCGMFANQIVMSKIDPLDPDENKYEGFPPICPAAPGGVPKSIKVRFAWCLVTPDKWGVDVHNTAILFGVSDVVQYAGGDATWNCNTPLTLTRVGPISDMCAGWPATITVTP